MSLPPGTPTVTINGIPCFELVQQLQEEFHFGQGVSANKAYLCDWGSRLLVAQGLLGLATTTSVGGGITLATGLPYPDLPTIYAHDIVIHGVGPPYQGARNVAYPSALIVCTFQNYPWSFSGIDYMQLDPTNPIVYAKQSMDMTVQYISVPGRLLKFATSGNSFGGVYSFACPIIQMTIELIRVPYLPSQQVLTSAQAPLNNAPFLGCDAGKVMFNGMRPTMTFDTAGNRTADLTLSFGFRPLAPWDAAYDPSNSRWDQVQNSAGNPLLGRSNLSALIPAGY